MTMFEKASRSKLTFLSPEGVRPSGYLSVNDLWDLELTQNRADVLDLNKLAKSINKQLKELDTDNFVDIKSADTEILELKLSIIKRVIEYKIEERDKRKAALANAQRKQELLELIRDKEKADRQSKSLDELKKEFNELQ